MPCEARVDANVWRRSWKRKRRVITAILDLVSLDNCGAGGGRLLDQLRRSADEERHSRKPTRAVYACLGGLWVVPDRAHGGSPEPEQWPRHFDCDGGDLQSPELPRHDAPPYSLRGRRTEGDRTESG